jgi:peptide/nickel transport system permease protein
MDSKVIVIFMAKRGAELIILVFIIITVTFFLWRVVPADPAGMVISPRFSPDIKAELVALWGLDSPLPHQYTIYVKNVLTSTYGVSYYYGEDVSVLLKRRFVPTLVLTGTAVVAALLIDYTLGKKKKSGQAGIIFYLVPFLWISLLLIALFSYHLDVAPFGGWKSPDVWQAPASPVTRALDVVHHLILPCLVMIVWSFIGCSLLKVNICLLFQKRKLIHPVMMTVLAAAVLFFGSTVVEVTFSWPGFYRTLLESLLTYDYPLSQGAFISAWLFNLVVVLLVEGYYVSLWKVGHFVHRVAQSEHSP